MTVWDEGGWQPLPQLGEDIAADVCVVGLGGSGLAAVGELLAAGASVVGVDAGAVAGGAAGRNGGFLLAGGAAFHHDAVAAVGRQRAARLYRLTLAELDRMTAETPELVRRAGSLRIAASAEEEADCAAHLAALRSDGFPAEPYDGPEGRGLLLPTDGTFQPLARCRVLARRALAGGADLFEQTPATQITGEAVATPRGVVRCGAAVVAVDGCLDRVLPELRGRVRTARAQMLATAPTAEVTLPRPVYARWGLDYWQQLDDGRVVLGGFRDRGGDAEWTWEATPTPAVQALLDAFLRGRLAVTAPVTHRWAGAIGFTPDRMPVLEEVRPRVWAAGAYSGTGNVLGALCGRAAAQLAVSGGTELAP